ncbi:hypothetical protein [Methylobacterium tarhaniae]|uniref:hypothetical protein n=1 Tax=Methylobacterium tarhaniae TaxID=1187852 RepID=UPI0012EE9D35|nr:hypothetical protein [Methylobacterium tarhaniae]
MDLDGVYVRLAATYSSALCGLFSSLLWARAAVRSHDVGSNVAAAGFTGAAVLFTLGASSNPEKIDKLGNILFSYSRYIGIYLGILYILALFADEVLRWKNEYFPSNTSKSLYGNYCKKYGKDNKTFSWPYF